jgi:ankyrin repeat protein
MFQEFKFLKMIILLSLSLNLNLYATPCDQEVIRNNHAIRMIQSEFININCDHIGFIMQQIQLDISLLHHIIRQYDINTIKTCHGNSLLDEMIENGNLEAVAILLEAGANLSKHSVNISLGEVNNGGVRIEYEILKMLLSKGEGLGVNQNDQHGTPLHFVISNNLNSEFIELLLEYGADINKRSNFNGFTPLDEAAYRGNEELTRYLISKGAKLSSSYRDSTNTNRSRMGSRIDDFISSLNLDEEVSRI